MMRRSTSGSGRGRGVLNLPVSLAHLLTVVVVAAVGCGWVCAADGVAEIDLSAIVEYRNLDLANAASVAGLSLNLDGTSFLADHHLRESSDVPGEFYDDYFMPKLTSQLWGVRGSASFEMMDPVTGNETARRTVADDTLRCIDRAVRHATNDWFMAITGWEERGREIATNIAGDFVSSTTADGKPKRVRYRVGAYHFLPKFGIDYRLGGTKRLALMLAAAGSVNVEYSHNSRQFAHVVVGYKHEDRTYHSNIRFSF